MEGNKMKLSEIFVAGFFMIAIISFAVLSIDKMSIFAPNITQNFTGGLNNISSIQAYNLSNEALMLQSKMENISVQGFGSDIFTQLTTAFGLSVFFGIEVIRVFFFAVISLPLTINSIIISLIMMMNIPLILEAWNAIAVMVGIGILIVIVIAVARLFKPDL